MDAKKDADGSVTDLVERFKARQRENSKRQHESALAREARLKKQREYHEKKRKDYLERRLAIAAELSRQKTVTTVALEARTKRYYQEEPQAVRDQYPIDVYLGWTPEEFTHFESTQELPKPCPPPSLPPGTGESETPTPTSS